MRRPVTSLIGFETVNLHLLEEITATGVRYDFGGGADLVGRRMPDVDLQHGRLSDLQHGRLSDLLSGGRGLLLDRTGRLAADGRSDRVDRVADPAAAIEAPRVLLRPDGHVVLVGD